MFNLGGIKSDQKDFQGSNLEKMKRKKLLLKNWQKFYEC